jgi:hypothetical protein
MGIEADKLWLSWTAEREEVPSAGKDATRAMAFI